MVADVARFEADLAQTVEKAGADCGHVVQVGGGCGQRLLDGDCRGKLFVVDVDESDRLVGGDRVLGGDGDDRFAHEADAVDGEDGTVLQGVTVVGIGRRQIAAGHDGDNAGERFGAAGVDGADAGVGVGAAQDAAVGHAVQAEIAGEIGFAGDLGDGVDARGVVADGGVGGGSREGGGHGLLLPWRFALTPTAAQRAPGPSSRERGLLTSGGVAIRSAASATASRMFQ